MAAIIEREFPGITIRHDRRDALMPERGTLNVEKARRLIGYEPATPLEAGYLRYIEWYRSLFSGLGQRAALSSGSIVNE
jgi:nucleoside-diphosphate-sugar epimerase